MQNKCKTPTPCLFTDIGLLLVRLQSLAKVNQQQIKTEFDSDELPDEVPIAEESNYEAQQLQPTVMNFYHNSQTRTPHQRKYINLFLIKSTKIKSYRCFSVLHFVNLLLTTIAYSSVH
ncbi:PREDICTED: uncharacterized protein LOC107340457 isoform X2 [Acropora digitifera]|uniref:uncharacterized protein LOC107340457 isoform X2 n=1 Tax=Acropora digitifera TaxID=70779 RepID=UPI000779F216|nr:PREDICTED: uncharacterized protein LOC107340457 isoform X2 [Acropora digitifera]